MRPGPEPPHDAGEERHRIEGFLPSDDFVTQLGLGPGRIHFSAGRFREAEKQFREVRERHPDSDGTAEARYWEGVSKYKRTNYPSALSETAPAFREAYGATSWAKKASV